MQFRQFLSGEQFDPDTMRLLGVAFEMARASTKLLDRPEITDDVIAKQIIILARGGERSADKLCDGALSVLTTRGRAAL